MNIHLDMELEDSSALSSRSTAPFLSPPSLPLLSILTSITSIFIGSGINREREEENSMADVTHCTRARKYDGRTDGRSPGMTASEARRERKGNRLSAVQRSLTVV